MFSGTCMRYYLFLIDHNLLSHYHNRYYSNIILICKPIFAYFKELQCYLYKGLCDEIDINGID